MKNNSRTYNSIRNIKYALIGQFAGIVISIIARFVFIKFLDFQYLGLSSLFSNILLILSLSDLGFGGAISYILYKPIVNNDTRKIKIIMNYFKKMYLIIFIIMILLGIVTLPFYPFFINETVDIPNLNLIYLLFVLNSACSYLIAYKRVLIISDQKKYIDIFYKYLFFFILNIVQMFVLFLTRNYILYLVVQIVLTVLENYFISKKINKLYPYLLEKDSLDDKMTSDDKKKIIRTAKTLFVHKFGGVVLNSTDNMVTSKILGLGSVGLYSNYYLIISAIDKIISQAFYAIVASIGNLTTISTKKKNTEVFEKVFFANFYVYAVIVCCLLNIFNPFITMWLGKKFLLSKITIIIIIINIYLYGMRHTCMAFRDATGNYDKDWVSPIIEAILNIIISIVLAKHIGLSGVFLGTIISSLCTNYWTEPLVICKKSLTIKLKNYLFLHFKYTIVVLLCSVISYYLCTLVSGVSILNLILLGIISFLTPNIVIFLFFHKNSNYIYFLNLLKNIINKYIIRNSQN